MIAWRALAPFAVVVALIAAVVFVLWRTYDAGHDAGVSSVKAEYEQRLSAQQRTHTAALIDAERKAVADMTAITDRYQEDVANAMAETERLAAAVRSGEQRLRERFTCPSAGVPAAGASAGSGDAGAARGLSAEDALFLVSIAAEADGVARQLRACQSIIKADRGLND